MLFRKKGTLSEIYFFSEGGLRSAVKNTNINTRPSAKIVTYTCGTLARIEKQAIP